MGIGSRTRISSRFALAIGLLALAPIGAGAEGAEKQESNVIAAGSTVSIEYTLTLDDGAVADSNVGGEALEYTQGSGQILPSLEAELVGLAAGETKKVDLEAEQGYGPVHEELFQTIELTQIPEDARKVGAMLVAQSAEGQQRPVRVHEVKESEVVIDHNHPLAGKNLHFAIKVLSVE